jgi:hypothetical protein
LTADVALPAAPAAANAAGPRVVNGDAVRPSSTVTAPMVALAAASGPSGNAGDYTATSLKPSGTWNAGGNSGDFTPFVPDLGAADGRQPGA